MAGVTGTLGTILWMTSSAISNSTALTIDTEAEFLGSVGNYTSVSYIENFGEFGKMFDLVTFQPVLDGRTYKLKGGYNSGTIQLGLGQDLSDDGQAELYEAANSTTQNRRAFRVELGDAPSSYGGGSMFYFMALPMSYRSNLGSVNNPVRATVNMEIDGEIVYVPPAVLFDTYVAGTNLDHYNLYAGTDPQAILPNISAGDLQMTTGNAGTGLAADGVEIVGDAADITINVAGFTTTFMAKVRLDIITNVVWFVGLTDNSASLEMPIEFPGGTLTSNATDAVGFVFDTAEDTSILMVGVRNDVDEAQQDSGVIPVADTYNILMMVIDSNADTTFYIDGVQVGSVMTSAVMTGQNLRPAIVVGTRNAISKTLRVDRVYMRQEA